MFLLQAVYTDRNEPLVSPFEIFQVERIPLPTHQCNSPLFPGEHTWYALKLQRFLWSAFLKKNSRFSILIANEKSCGGKVLVH